MLSIFFLALAQSQRKICICNFECSSLCPSENYIITSSNFQIQYLYTIKYEQEIELNFYSPEDNFTYEINMSYFSGKKLILKNLLNSKTIKLLIKDESTTSIEIKPDFQINLPSLIPFKSTPLLSNKAILMETSPSTTPIPISVGLSQFETTGYISCDPLDLGFSINNINDLGCPLENLESQAAYQCGFRCWTSGTTSFKYTFKGVKVAVYGTLASAHRKFYIKIDENEPIEINEEDPNRQEYVQLYINETPLEYKDHTIEIYGDDVYEIHKISYWPTLKAQRLNSTELTKTGTWTKETDGIGGVREKTDTAGAKATATIRTSKIYVYGNKANSYGSMKVNFNGHEQTVDENSEPRSDGVLLYESDEFEFGTYDLDISLLDGTISIYCIYYEFDPPPQTMAPFPSESPTATPVPPTVPISIGLTQMINTGSKNCHPGDVDFGPNSINNIGCDYTNLDSPDAYNCGFVCWGETMNYEYNFLGVKFIVYGTLDPNHRKFDLVIDDGDPIEIDEYKSERHNHYPLYTSDELEYKEHNIKIKSKDQTYELYKIAYWPSLNARRLNITDFTKTGTWKSETDGIGGVREYTESNGATAEITITCSKLWIYGSKASHFQDMIINFNGEEKTINPRSDERIDSTLLFETVDLPFDTYTLLIKSPIYPIMVYSIFYVDDWAPLTSTPMPTLTATQSPDPSSTPDPTNTPLPSNTPNPTPTPTPTPVPISVGLTQMDHVGRVYCNVAYFGIENIQNLGCNTDDLDVESAYKCGYKCWSYGEANFSYSFIGVKFEIYGTYDPFHKKFDLTIDEKETIEIDEYNETRRDYVVVYSSDLLDYKNHTVRINGKGETYELYKLVYWPRIEARRMNTTELEKTGQWKKESDGIGGIREYTNNAGDTASVTFVCTKIWVYSSVCSWHNDMIITFDNKQHNIELNSDVRKDGVLVFESEDVPYGEHTLSFSSTGTIMICSIYYLNDPPPPTRTPFPSRTEYPETNQTYIDKTFINYILTDQIEVVEDSPIEQISGCQFIEILEDIDYLIRIEKEIPFFDNSFTYKVNQSNPCAPIISNFNGNFSIVNCTFTNSRCRVRNGGNVFTSPSNFIIDLYLESCEFVDCGLWQNETILKIMNLNSSIKMTDCSISFQNETTASKVIDASCSSISIDSCSFYKSGSIFIETSDDTNLSIQFTNNSVNSISGPFISAAKVTSSLMIENNVFHDIQITNLSFINITHDLDEIEFKNNSFENVRMYESENFGVCPLILIETVENLSSTIIFDKCHFIGNENNRSSDSFYRMGGAIQFGYFYSNSSISIQFNECEFKQNSCHNGKGGALALSVFDDVVISGCVFEGNMASEEGSSIYFPGYSDYYDQIQLNLISITDCVFVDNQGTNCIYICELNIRINTVEIYSCVFLDNDCDDNLQFIIQTSSNNVNFVNNSVTFSEAGDKYGSFIINYTKLAVLTDTLFVNCQASTDMAMIFNGNDDESFATFTNCTFVNCISKRYSVSIQKGNPTISNCTFTFTSNRNACSGLEINQPNSVEINNCSFMNNNNKFLNSGSLFIHSDNKSPDKLTINGLLFSACIGSSYRTISVSFPSIKEDVLVIEKVQILDISTGASIYGISIDKDVTFNHCVFKNNLFGNQLGGGYGSYLIPSTHICFNFCEWTNNYCSDNGGAFGGVIYNVGNVLLSLKSLTFNGCQFTSNSCLGNGGSLYIDMSVENSPVLISNCVFEMNKANGDCGAIYVKNRGQLTVDCCSFKNNSATKSIGASIDPTDGLYVTGNFNVLINNTNFTKGSYSSEQTYFQFTHVNSEINNRDFNITIAHSMFSIINPTNSQLFAQEIDNVGSFYISFSTFTHFNTKFGTSSAYLLDSKDILQSDFNHLFRDLNAPVHINDCCFDNDEYIIRSNLRSKDSLLLDSKTKDSILHDSENKDSVLIDSKTKNSILHDSENKDSILHDSENKDSILIDSENKDLFVLDLKSKDSFLLGSSFTSKDNIVKGQCNYPQIIDQMIIDIESYENRTISTPSPSPSSNKKIIIIASVVAAVVVIIAVVLTVVLVLRCRRRNSESLNSDEEESEDEQAINERNFANFATKMVTQENPLFTQFKQTKLPSSDSSFEESRWVEDFI